ncbi:MAG: DHHA1 domain-containing protein [Clostridiales bacterium]|nr:DHHA1 domain-containing protein [Clostridiales bacterium]
MTERVFLTDSHIKECTATALAAEPAEGGAWVLLDRTVFFPAKGGQPCDTGTIDGLPVTAVEERGEEIWHFIQTTNYKLQTTNNEKTAEQFSPQLSTFHFPLSTAANARPRPTEIKIDWERRFDIMQQHTGEHLLSWCAWQLFGAVNVGFHCALGYATLDLDIPLSHEQLREVEDRANALAAENLPVTVTMYEREEDLADLPLRKSAEGLTAPIRIVTIEGADRVACCAPHVARTGQIGQMKITEAVAWKGGMRLRFLCGARALRHAQGLQDEMDALARCFSTGEADVRAAVVKQGEELSTCRRALSGAQAALDGYRAVELIAQAIEIKGNRLLVAQVPGLSGKRLRALALKTLTGKSLTLLFSAGEDRLDYMLCLNGLKHDAGALMQAVNAAVRGKGGGRGDTAQGSASTVPAELYEIMEQLQSYFTKVL